MSQSDTRVTLSQLRQLLNGFSVDVDLLIAKPPFIR